MQTFADRPHYIKSLHSLAGTTDMVKFIIGVKVSGKTTLLELFRQDLLKRDPHARVLGVSLNTPEFSDLVTPLDIYRHIKPAFSDEAVTTVLIDGIEHCSDVDWLLKYLLAPSNTDVYAAISPADYNAFCQRLNLIGQYFPIELLPLSFAEFLAAVREDGLHLEEDFKRYLAIGGFPGILPLRHDAQACKAFLNRLATEAATEDLLFTVPVYDILHKALFPKKSRSFACDAALLTRLLSDSGREQLLENVVYLELRRRYPDVFVGALRRRTVDFVVRSYHWHQCYVQVAAGQIPDEKEINREIAPFYRIPDKHPCVLLAETCFGSGNCYDGVLQVNLLEWLADPEAKLIAV